MRRWWERYRWPVISALFVVVLVLGYVGYRTLLDERGESYTVADLLYLDLQLFFVNVSERGDDLPWTLVVAKFAAPALAGYSALVAISRLFRDRIDEFRFRFTSGHAIVVGAGDTGMVFTRALRRLGRKVLVVDADAANPNLGACRELGAGVMVADASEPETLLRGGLLRASQLIATTGSDTANAEVVLEAGRLVRKRSEPLHCIAHIVDADLWRLLRAHELRGADDRAVQFDFFNLYAAAARRLLSDHPPFLPEADEAGGVVVVGGGELGEQVVLEVGRRWSMLDREQRLPVTVLADRGTELAATLVAGSPQLGLRCDLRGLDGPVDALTVHTALADVGPVRAAYVCMDDDSAAIAVAGVLQNHLPAATVVLCTPRATGFVGLLNEPQLGLDRGLGAVHAFSVLEQTCHPELRLLAIDENLARSIHEHHRELRLQDGADPDESSLRDWDALPEDLRNSNRQQARHISTKLRAIACDVVPTSGWEPTRMGFTPDEVERLAQMEHERWVDERTSAGWQRGETADSEQRISPYLEPWADLPEQAREWNRESVREIPDLVALEGFEVVRLAPPPWLETVARAIHDQYRDRRKGEGSAVAPWEDLAPELQGSNRDQAASIPAQLEIVGCELVPSASANGFDGFTQREVELLAEREHERWVRERTLNRRQALAGDLVPWPQLAEDRRELDREAVRAIPAVVAAAGLGVTRHGAS